MNVNGQTITVTLQVPQDVYDRASQTARHEQRSLEDLLSRLLAEGLNVHGTVREVFEQVSAQYRARLLREGKLSQSADEILQELRNLREKIVRTSPSDHECRF